MSCSQKVREPSYATLTYLVKTGPRGDSGCAAREADIDPPPVFDDAGLAAAPAAQPPPTAVAFGSEPSGLVLEPWAKEQRLEDCGPIAPPEEFR